MAARPVTRMFVDEGDAVTKPPDVLDVIAVPVSYWISYFVIAAPVVPDGAVQSKVALVEDAGCESRPVAVAGTFTGTAEIEVAAPDPIEFAAVTRMK